MVNPAKTVALPPKGHDPTVEEISLLESVDVHIADDCGVAVDGVPIDTDEYVLDRATEVVKNGGSDHLAWSRQHAEHASAGLIAIESFGQRTSCLERAPDTGLSLEACSRADNGAQWVYEKILELPGAAEEHSFFRRGARIIG